MDDKNRQPQSGFAYLFNSDDFEETKILRWVLSLVFAVFAIINGWHIVSLLLLVAAVLVMPIRAPEVLLSKIKPTTALIIVLAIVLIGLVIEPVIYDKYVSPPDSSDVHNSGTGGQNDNNSSGGGQTAGGSSGSSNKEENNDTTDKTDNKDESSDSDSKEESNPDKEGTYVLNINSKKFHYPDCYQVDRMDDVNKEEFTGSRAELIADGYTPCGICKP